jgi:hypothetical protein
MTVEKWKSPLCFTSKFFLAPEILTYICCTESEVNKAWNNRFIPFIEGRFIFLVYISPKE